MENRIALRRLGRLVVRRGRAQQPDRVVATVTAEMAALGFVPDEPLLDALRTLEDERLRGVVRELLDALAHAVGAHRAFEPLYPDFPDGVINQTDAELYLNAVTHYLTAGAWRPPRHRARVSFRRLEDPKVIGLASVEDLDAVFTRLAGSATSLSPTDIADLDWFVRQYRGRIARLLPSRVPHREVTAVLAAALWQYVPELGNSFVGQHVRTATDVLRWCAALCGGDVSLAEPTFYLGLSRAVRRTAMDILEAAANLDDDLARRPERWKRLGERLHPGEFHTTHPRAAAAFAVLRAGGPAPTLASRVERALATRDVDAALVALVERPGELARRLDHLLRLAADPSAVLDRFGRAAPWVSTVVLLQVGAHFTHRGSARPTARPGLRPFLPKGATAKLWARVEDRPPLPADVARRVVDTAHGELRRRFASLPGLGACYLSAELVNYTVPLTQRSASRSFRTVARGSRLPLPAGQVIRLFLWWKNGRRRTDIDLSAALFDADYRFVDELAYYSLKSWGAVHSGDIVDAPNGAAEFIDLDVRVLRERGIRYVAATLTSYTEQPYCDLPECYAGWMSRTSAGSGQIFEPTTVIDRVDLTADTTFAIPLFFDLVDRKAIWADLALRSNPRFVNAVGANLKGVSMLLESMATLRRPDLHTLLRLHAEARGHLVNSPKLAATVFAPTGTITPFDIDRIRAEFLTD